MPRMGKVLGEKRNGLWPLRIASMLSPYEDIAAAFLDGPTDRNAVPHPTDRDAVDENRAAPRSNHILVPRVGNTPMGGIVVSDATGRLPVDEYVRASLYKGNRWTGIMTSTRITLASSCWHRNTPIRGLSFIYFLSIIIG